MFYNCLAMGGDGGILASSHIHTDIFLQVYSLMQANNHHAAHKEWRKVENLIPLLFKEPNPAPLKFILHRQKLIQSPEVRLPLVEITDELKKRFEDVGM
jgi:4-hydroxy-tetrahydrodipicolinate synthase